MFYDEEHYNQLSAVCRCYRQDAERYEKQKCDLEQENKQLKGQLAIREKALELAVNYCQREIDGDGIGMQDIQAIYEIGTEFFINKAKENIK